MENVLYTDGHGIRVTTAGFFTGKTFYRMEGIINARINLIKAYYAPAVWLMIAGMFLLTSGILNLMPDTDAELFYLYGITANMIAIGVGILLLITGLILSAVLHERYSVRIVTAEGEKDPVISEKKEYIKQIVSAIQDAMKLRSSFSPGSNLGNLP